MYSKMHEANKNNYGLTKELFWTRMTKTTHVCSAICYISRMNGFQKYWLLADTI